MPSGGDREKYTAITVDYNAIATITLSILATA